MGLHRERSNDVMGIKVSERSLGAGLWWYLIGDALGI
jgi:hypothetical protein